MCSCLALITEAQQLCCRCMLFFSIDERNPIHVQVLGWDSNGTITFNDVVCTRNTALESGGCFSGRGRGIVNDGTVMHSVVNNGTVMHHNHAEYGGCICESHVWVCHRGLQMPLTALDASKIYSDCQVSRARYIDTFTCSSQPQFLMLFFLALIAPA